MSVLDGVVKQKQTLAKLERTLARQKIKERKADTRRKIEFGGLVIKAKMDEYPKAVILGALLDAMENLNRDDNCYQLFKTKGEVAFMGF